MKKEYTYTGEQITLRNAFHGTEVNLRPCNGKLTRGQVNTSKMVLCGIKGCSCSDDLGCRGQQDVQVEVLVDGRSGNISGAVIRKRRQESPPPLPRKASEESVNYRFDDAYCKVYDDDTGEYLCSYAAAGIRRQDIKAVAIKKMEQREELLALEDAGIDKTWID